MESRKKVRVFNFGGRVFWGRSDLESRKKVRVLNFGGVFWVRSDLDSGKNGGGVLEPNPRTPGCSGEFGQKFLEA